MKIINLEIYSFIEQQLREIVNQILPNNEKSYLPPNDEINNSNSLLPLLDYIFVIEKFISSKILPLRWKIIKSESFDNSPLKEKYKVRLSTLEKMLTNGDIRINSPSYNYLPKSQRRFFNTFYNDKNKYRYVSDFTDSFFGIKHLHLNQDHNDELLFYAVSIHEKTIYFLHLGNHEKLFTKTILEIIINHFPNLIETLGIMELSGIIPGKENLTVKVVKALWSSGNNVSFNINNTVYIGMPQSCARINMKITQIQNNIIWQVENQTKDYINYLAKNGLAKENYQIDVLKLDTDFSLTDGVLFIKEREALTTGKIYIDYFQNLSVAKMLLLK